jgi:hypothetical protein
MEPALHLLHEVAAALRFRVVVSGIEIGRFTRCSGLGFAYDVLDYPEGGERSFTHRLRGGVRHANLKLERGVTDETALLDWFFASHEQHQRRTVTVFLLGDGGAPQRHWAFDGALPLRWHGPELDAAAARVAVESLEIAHEGLVMTSPGAGARGAAPARSFQRARLEIEGGGEVACWLNPSQYTITQSNDFSPGREASAGAQELTVELLFDAADDPTRSVSDVCGSLFAAVEPGPFGEGDARRPPHLVFAWGEGQPFRAVARRLSARYELFRADGEPSRARVELTLVRVDAPRMPGRTRRPGVVGDERVPGGVRAHIVTVGDSLPAIAHESYGDAHQWRVIAEANRIDDPLRSRAGMRLDIPAAPVRPAGEPASEPPAGAGVGSGVAFPLQVDRAGGVALARGSQDVVQAIEIVLGTEPGERPMRPEFGCALQQFFFERVDPSTLGRIRDEVLRALSRWEPRIDVLDVHCDAFDAALGQVTVNVTYTLSDRAEVQTLSHPVSVLAAEEARDAA